MDKEEEKERDKEIKKERWGSGVVVDSPTGPAQLELSK